MTLHANNWVNKFMYNLNSIEVPSSSNSAWPRLTVLLFKVKWGHWVLATSRMASKTATDIDTDTHSRYTRRHPHSYDIMSSHTDICAHIVRGFYHTRFFLGMRADPKLLLPKQDPYTFFIQACYSIMAVAESLEKHVSSVGKCLCVHFCLKRKVSGANGHLATHG